MAESNLQKATFGAGCFWQVEEIFRNIKGVRETAAGYAGGRLENPTYEQVCADSTGHAEVVEILYDPKEVNYEELLKIFFENHDPTTLNRQGPDVGSQYRSAIFFHHDEQKKIAEKYKSELEKSGKFKKPIVTEISPASTFYRAEEYHQKYLAKRGLSTCPI
jgi:peptide-methionine (S)-S-oxide reductase